MKKMKQELQFQQNLWILTDVSFI